MDHPTVFGVEGPTWPAVRALAPDAELEGHLRAAELVDAYPDTAAVSSHLLAVARTDGRSGGVVVDRDGLTAAERRLART